MRKNFNEKSLMVVNEESLLYKIKKFFLRLFRRKEIIENEPQIVNIDNNESQINNQKMLLWNLLEILKMKKLSY